MKYNLAEIDLLKILHDLKFAISAYDTILGWVTHWNSKKNIFHLILNYKFKKLDQLFRDLATR